MRARSGGTVELSLIRDSMQQRNILGGEKELYGGTNASGMVYPSTTVATPVSHGRASSQRC